MSHLAPKNLPACTKNILRIEVPVARTMNSCPDLGIEFPYNTSLLVEDHTRDTWYSAQKQGSTPFL